MPGAPTAQVALLLERAAHDRIALALTDLGTRERRTIAGGEGASIGLRARAPTSHPRRSTYPVAGQQRAALNAAHRTVAVAPPGAVMIGPTNICFSR